MIKIALNIRCGIFSLLMLMSVWAEAEVINCPNCDLEGKDYSGETLANSNFSGANLTNANFKNADLKGANFQDANLTGANFTGATLSSDTSDPSVPSMFQSANLSGAVFTKAKLNAVDFQYTSMSCTDFSRVDTSNAVFGYLLDINDAEGCQTSFAKSKITCELATHRRSLDFTDADMPTCDAGSHKEAAPDKIEHSVSDDGKHSVSITRTQVLPTSNNLDKSNQKQENLTTASQTVFVNTDGTDTSGCGTKVASSCKTIQYGASQCSSADCLVAVAYGTYSPSASIAPAKGAITIAGGYVNGVQNTSYQSRVLAPAGSPVFALTASDSGITLQNLLLQGADATTSAATSALSATSTALTLDYVLVTAGKGGAGTPGNIGTAGTAGNKGGSGSGSGTGRTGGSSTCNATGGTGGKTDSITGSSSFTWYLVCKEHCETTWYNGSSGSPGGTGNYAAGSALAKGDSLACYACPEGRGSMPKSAATATAGSNGSCGAGGTESTSTAGTMSASGAWSPSVGSNGTGGFAGGGGGGGGPGGSCGYANCVCSYSTYAGGAGGGGGSGGCGGTQGTGGGMGGASFGMVLASSTVTFNGSKNVITAKQGGTGGIGGAGINGGTGGAGGSGQSYSNTCNDGGASGATGGAGGKGGASGGGAGGNGGPSVNIAMAGTGSTISGTPLYYAGASGTPGSKGDAGSTSGNCTATAAADGVSGLVANTKTY